MRNLLMLLVVANVLYFLWDRYVAEPDQSGVAIVDENQLGPPLEISKNSVATAATSVGAVLGSGKPSELAAVVGRSCVSILFRRNGEAITALTEYRNEGMHASLRSGADTTFIGYWVQIRDIPNSQIGEEMIATLQTGGIPDVFLMEEDGKFKISLGLFGEMSRAESVERQALALDLPADITDRMQDTTVFFLDIGLLPGKGAGAMIEEYGEERVMLRQEAICPRSD